MSVFTCPRSSDEIYALYADYINQRHGDGDMYPPSLDQFESFLCQGHLRRADTRFICFRLEQKLLAVAVVDLLPKGLSAIYTFFDPAYDVKKPGAPCSAVADTLGSSAQQWTLYT